MVLRDLRAWLAPALYMALIFALSSVPLQLPQIPMLRFQDKLLHALEYSLLGWLCARASRTTWPGAGSLRISVFAVFVAALFGLSDELHQSFVPGRSADIFDVLADFVGSALGAWVHHRRLRT